MTGRLLIGTARETRVEALSPGVILQKMPLLGLKGQEGVVKWEVGGMVLNKQKIYKAKCTENNAYAFR